MSGATAYGVIPYMTDTDPMHEVAQASEDLAERVADLIPRRFSVVVPVVASVTGVVALNFGETFSAPPIMAATVVDNSNYFPVVGVVTATGCNVHVKQFENVSGTANITVHVIAVGIMS
jgi:hypothetical protein